MFLVSSKLLQFLLPSVTLLFISSNYRVNAKHDEIVLENDQRNLVHLVSFGMFNGGIMDVNISVTINSSLDYAKAYSLTIDKTRQASSGYVQYGESVLDPTHGCDESKSMENKTITFSFLLTKSDGGKLSGTLQIHTPPQMANVGVSFSPLRLKRSLPETNTSSAVELATTLPISNTDFMGSTFMLEDTTAQIPPETTPPTETKPKIVSKPLTVESKGGNVTFSLTFKVQVKDDKDAGLYSLFFHNCALDKTKRTAPIGKLKAQIVGKNTKPETFLSAGDIPKPYLYYCVCATYIVISFIWLSVLRRAKTGVFKTHYLMLALCYCKALAALFHGTNIYYIGKKGEEETAWAVIYYISYLMKTIMLFLTILLVGTGWTFIKHVFSDKEKKLFLVALPLQVLVYVSHVIMSETEVATTTYTTWKTISIVVDLLCCAAILLPVVWSIRHLSVVSKTDEKAAQNLRKLQLFKSLYVMVIAYIYISRIILYVLDFILPYQYAWVGNLFSEVTVLIFLVTLGYKFRPAENNPYFQVPVADEEEEYASMAVTKSGLTTETKRRNVTFDVEAEETDKQALLSRNRNNESSHDLD